MHNNQRPAGRPFFSLGKHLESATVCTVAYRVPLLVEYPGAPKRKRHTYFRSMCGAANE